MFCYNNSKKATAASVRGQGLVITAAFKFLHVYEVSLSFFDDKIYVLDDGVNTLTYFYKDCNK